jgi:hypothetical protein
MPKSTPVPLQRADAIILGLIFLGGFSAALFIDWKFKSHEFGLRFGKPPTSLPEWIRSLELSARRLQYDLTACLIAITPAIGLAAFRRRVTWKCHGFPGPGVAAIAASSLAVIHHVAERACIVFSNESGGWIWAHPAGVSWSPREFGYGVSVLQVGAGVTGAILGVWAYLLLAQAWEPRDEWRDLLGRGLAFCWLGEMGFEVLAPALWG